MNRVHTALTRRARRTAAAAARPSRRTRLGAALALTAFVLTASGVGGADAQTEAGDAEVAPTPVVSWGTTGAGPGQFRFPSSVALGPDGTVYVGDGTFTAPQENHRVQAFTSSGTFLRAWDPTFGDGFDGLSGVQIRVAPDGTVYTNHWVRDSGYLVQRFTPEGVFIDNWPHGFPEAFSATGNLLVRVDDNTIREVGLGGATVRQWTITDAESIGSLTVGADGKIYASMARRNSNEERIAVLSSGGALIRTFVAAGSGRMAVHPDGYVILAAPLAGLFRYTTTGTLVDQWTATTPTDVAVDSAGNVVVTEMLADRVRIVRPVGPDGWRRKADAHIGTGGAYAGNNVYNLTGAGQSKSNTTCSTQYAEAFFVIKVENNGNVADRFTVKSPAGNSRFTVRYTSQGGTVTSRVVAGTFRTPHLLAGQTTLVQVWVKAKAGTPRGAAITQTATITSEADPTKKDVVKYTATRGAC